MVVSPAGAPMLMDFGISYLLRDSDLREIETQAESGSLRWLAPELILSDGSEILTRESDIWALGMTFLVRLLRICNSYILLT